MPDPFRTFLRGLPDDIDRAHEAGLPVVLELDAPLPVHAQRLMDTLGVEVHVVTATAANGLVTTCPVKTCSWTFVGDDAKARPYVESHLSLMHGRHRHRPVLEKREPQAAPAASAPAAAPSRSSSTNRAQWTRQRIIDAIRRWAIDHDGRPPTRRDWLTTAPDHPNAYVVATTFASWADAIEAAGYGRPTRGTRRKEPAARVVSLPAARVPAPERALAEREAEPVGPDPSRSAGPRDLTAVRAAAHQLVDAAHQLVDAIFEALG